MLSPGYETGGEKWLAAFQSLPEDEREKMGRTLRQAAYWVKTFKHYLGATEAPRQPNGEPA
jgi:hypothetical protein